jgi:hypothetical protein
MPVPLARSGDAPHSTPRLISGLMYILSVYASTVIFRMQVVTAQTPAPNNDRNREHLGNDSEISIDSSSGTDFADGACKISRRNQFRTMLRQALEAWLDIFLDSQFAIVADSSASIESPEGYEWSVSL